MDMIAQKTIPIYWQQVYGKAVNIVVNDVIDIPSQYPLDEIVGRIISKGNIPCFAVDDIKHYLSQVLEEETWKFYDEQYCHLVDTLHKGETDIDTIASGWQTTFENNVAEYRHSSTVSDEEIFAIFYSSLVHSETVISQIRMEQQFALAVANKIDQRDMIIANMDKSHSEETDRALAQRGPQFSAEVVNQLAQRHCADRQMLESRWASDLSTLKEDQRRDYRGFVMSLETVQDTGKEEQKMGNQASPETALDRKQSFYGDDQVEPSKKAELSSTLMTDKDGAEAIMRGPKWEESFTIQLGRQMRSMHNMRLVCGDMVDLCRWHYPDDEPQRLHTAMSLYSNQLSAMVLMVDNRLNTFRGIMHKFGSVVERSTEFHFSNLDVQLNEIKESVRAVNRTRSGHHSEVPGHGDSPQVGDVYVTRHSTLAGVQVVFHLVVDDSVMDANLRYPSPLHVALRNLLRACFIHDVNTLSIPLLLTHNMREHMNVSWCSQRVETVFKAVKGAMIELCTWRGKEPRTIEFVVPPEINEEMFHTFSSTLSTFFQLPIPVKSL